MSYILSTTYSSGHGLVAAEYACGLAALLRCSVRLMYAYTVPITFGEMPLPVMPAEDARLLAAEHMETAIGKLRNRFPHVDISGELAYGDLADVLDEAARQSPPRLTVIGNDEEPDFDGWIGSHAAEILREAGYPVLAVPHSAVFRGPAHICIAGDSRSIGAGASVDILTRLQEACDTRITVLHILAEGESPVAFADSTLGRQLAKCNAAYVELQAPGAVDGAIASYAASQETDWLAVVPHQYGFWEGLFHKSHTTHMLHLAHLPILALH
jgi:nucleotide-binding universal stress UspA family protein